MGDRRKRPTPHPPLPYVTGSRLHLDSLDGHLDVFGRKLAVECFLLDVLLAKNLTILGRGGGVDDGSLRLLELVHLDY